MIQRDMALSLGNPKAIGKGGLTCHICAKTVHFAKECQDIRKPTKVVSNTATTSRDVCRYCLVEMNTYRSSRDSKQVPTTRLYNCPKFKNLTNATERGDT